MTPQAHALTVLADLREDEAIVRYLTGINGPVYRGPAVAGSPSRQPVSATHPLPGRTGAPLATPTIVIRLHHRPSSRGGGEQSGRRSLLLAVIVAFVFAGLALIGLSSWLLRRITGRRGKWQRPERT